MVRVPPIAFTRMFEPRHIILSNVRADIRKNVVSWLKHSLDCNRPVPGAVHIRHQFRGRIQHRLIGRGAPIHDAAPQPRPQCPTHGRGAPTHGRGAPSRATVLLPMAAVPPPITASTPPMATMPPHMAIVPFEISDTSFGPSSVKLDLFPRLSEIIFQLEQNCVKRSISKAL